ncbi:MAG TPA: hypothetical protein VEH47_08225 [Candidatus Acidoferrales bacterium]|nr:hypothetical protein [Candidatus Acidoferrales bacterium]
MNKWGCVISLFFIGIVLGLLVPAAWILTSNSTPAAADLEEVYQSWGSWICAGFVILGQILLLWLRVDTTQKRLKPRTHVLVSAVTTALLMAILTADIVFAIGAGVRGDKFLDVLSDSAAVNTLIVFGVPWLIWAVVFYRLWRDSNDPVTRAVAWLFRGSVLELLIAVPAHVIVRRRHDCSAPVATSFGITTGIAIMLISFGPSVLLLFKKRMEKYSVKPSIPR